MKKIYFDSVKSKDTIFEVKEIIAASGIHVVCSIPSWFSVTESSFASLWNVTFVQEGQMV